MPGFLTEIAEDMKAENKEKLLKELKEGYGYPETKEFRDVFENIFENDWNYEVVLKNVHATLEESQVFLNWKYTFNGDLHAFATVREAGTAAMSFGYLYLSFKGKVYRLYKGLGNIVEISPKNGKL